MFPARLLQPLVNAKENRPFPPDFMYTTLCVNYGFDMQFSKFYGSFFPLKGTFFVFLSLSSARKRAADRFQWKKPGFWTGPETLPVKVFDIFGKFYHIKQPELEFPPACKWKRKLPQPQSTKNRETLSSPCQRQTRSTSAHLPDYIGGYPGFLLCWQYCPTKNASVFSGTAPKHQ